MGQVVDSYRFAAAGGDPATVAYVTELSTITDGSSATYSAASIGTADADRTVIIAAAARFTAGTAQTITGVTVGGVAATELVQINSGNQVTVGLFAIDVAAGTTADVVVSLSASAARHGIGVYRCTGISTTPNDVASSAAAGGSESVDVTAGGIVVGVGGTSTSGGTFTWTGITEDFDAQMGSEQGRTSGASDEFASASTVAITATAASGTQAAAYAAW